MWNNLHLERSFLKYKHSDKKFSNKDEFYYYHANTHRIMKKNFKNFEIYTATAGQIFGQLFNSDINDNVTFAIFSVANRSHVMLLLIIKSYIFLCHKE